MTDEDEAVEHWRNANEQILVETGREIWATLDAALKEELRAQPKTYRRILDRLKAVVEAKYGV
jgi:hypothetical protein